MWIGCRIWGSHSGGINYTSLHPRKTELFVWIRVVNKVCRWAFKNKRNSIHCVHFCPPAAQLRADLDEIRYGKLTLLFPRNCNFFLLILSVTFFTGLNEFLYIIFRVLWLILIAFNSWHICYTYSYITICKYCSNLIHFKAHVTYGPNMFCEYFADIWEKCRNKSCRKS